MEYVPDFAFASDPFLKGAFYLGLGIVGLMVLLLLQVLVLSFLKRYRDRRNDVFTTLWRPILSSTIDGVPEEIPRIKKRDAITFIYMWNHYHQILKGNSKDNLNKLFLRLELNLAAIRMLRKGRFKNKISAIIAFGNLRDSAVWPDLGRCILDEDGHLSYVAAKAMIQISPSRAIPAIMPILSRRDDWPPSMVATLLEEAGPTLVSGPLIDAIRAAPLTAKPRLIRYLEVLPHKTSGPIIRELLQNSSDEEVLTACLHIAKDSLLLDRIRQLTGHDAWFIRAVAATALGRIGHEDDIPRLMGLLSDSKWWVRYRAARAIASLPFITLNQVKKVKIAVDDPFGKDVMTQVIAEKEAGRWS